VPGIEHKEDWASGSLAAIFGGVTTVLEMPNTSPATTTERLFKEKVARLTEQLKTSGINLHYKLWFGATGDNADEIEKVKDDIVGIKLFMGASTGTLLVDSAQKQEEVFKLAAKLNLPVAVHAEDELVMQDNKKLFAHERGVQVHSKIRSPQAAATAVARAIGHAKKTGARLYILHVSTATELELIRAAKKEGVLVFAEATPHHLFLTTEAYETLGTKAQMNPPLRSATDQAALWAAVVDGTIDTIATDHAPHLLAEKALPYPDSPSGVPGIETMLPLLLNACHEGRLTLERLVELTSANPRRIFGLAPNNDWVVIDQNLTKTVANETLKTKCGWSPFNGWNLTGWPVYTVLDNVVFEIGSL
jgi:dihydroorotase